MEVFQFCAFWSPTEKQFKEEGMKPKMVVDIQTVIAMDEDAVKTVAARAIPDEFDDQLDQVTVVVRPF